MGPPNNHAITILSILVITSSIILTTSLQNGGGDLDVFTLTSSWGALTNEQVAFHEGARTFKRSADNTRQIHERGAVVESIEQEQEQNEFLPKQLSRYGNFDTNIDEFDFSLPLRHETAAIETTTYNTGHNKLLNNSTNILANGNGNAIAEDKSTYKSVEYEEAPSDILLNGFVTGKLSAPEDGNTLPIFLVEPESVYLVKNRPAVLKCKAAHALQLYFKCSGSSQPPPSTHDKHVDPHSGVHLEEVVATIHRDLVDEYFGKGPFKCECVARYSRGVIKSQAAEVNIAYIRKHFVSSPTSLRVEAGTRAELHCEAPDGVPVPKITWYKNKVPISRSNEHSLSVTLAGTLTFLQVSLQDMANYTCSAENIAGKRISDSAVLIVYVNGGWSSWNPWIECKCMAKPSQGRKRTRTCTNPTPMNGGAPCTGSQIQKTPDCESCAEDTQILHTKGYNISRTNKPYYDWTLYLGIAFVTAICFAFGAALIWCARRNIWANPHYNMARTVMDSEYMQSVDKKDVRLHIEAVNASYDYPNSDHRFMANNTIGCSISEHHYDVPNLSASYTNPIDELRVEYLLDTPDVSLADTSNSLHDNTTKHSTLSASRSCASNILTSSGGSVRLYGFEIMLCVPELAIGKSQKREVTLQLLNDDSNLITMQNSESLLVCSNVVHCTVRNYLFLKPVILKIPHCLIEPEIWNVKIYHADGDATDGMNVKWRKIVAVGEETINTPLYVQVDPAHIYVMTELLGRFAVIADLKANAAYMQPSIRMKLIAFGQIMSSNAKSSIRIYVVKDLPNSKDNCTSIESLLGGTYMGESENFAFQLNNCNLNIRLRIANSGDAGVGGDTGCDVDSDEELYEHVIPYNHILSNSSIIHCEFSIRCNQSVPSNTAQTYDIDFMQYSDITLEGELCSFSIMPQCGDLLSSDTSKERQTMVSIDRQGNYINTDMTPVTIDHSIVSGGGGGVQLSNRAKRLICNALDPPRADERDWRLLAHKLNTDRYMAYFATKPSPTEQILNLWECRANNSSHNIVKLLMILKEMERQDVMDVITETIGPLWM